MSVLTTVDRAVVDAAETYFAEVETIAGDIAMTRTLPTLDEVDDLILRLTGVRAVVAGEVMPSGGAEQRGLLRLLEARRADVAGLLEDDRDEQVRGVNSCVEPVAARIVAYEAKLAGLDDVLDRLRSYAALRTVRLACAAMLLRRSDAIRPGVQNGEWPAEVQAFADDDANDETIRGVVAAMCAEYDVQDIDLLAKLAEGAKRSAAA